MKPHAGAVPIASGSSSEAGVTTSVAVAVASPDRAHNRCQPRARSAGSSKVASPTSRPSTSSGCTHRSSCARSSRRLPSSSSTHTWTGEPWGTCTQNDDAEPARATTVGASIRRHGVSRSSARDARVASGDVASAPSAASTAITVLAGTAVCRPCQSRNSVATPCAAASSITSWEGIESTVMGDCGRRRQPRGPARTGSRIRAAW